MGRIWTFRCGALESYRLQPEEGQQFVSTEDHRESVRSHVVEATEAERMRCAGICETIALIAVEQGAVGVASWLREAKASIAQPDYRHGLARNPHATRQEACAQETSPPDREA